MLRILFTKSTKKWKGQTRGDLPSDFDPALHAVLEARNLNGVIEFTGKRLNDTEDGLRDATATELRAENYAEDRLKEYPTHEEFMHAWFDGGTVALDALATRRNATKVKYPKS